MKMVATWGEMKNRWRTGNRLYVCCRVCEESVSATMFPNVTRNKKDKRKKTAKQPKIEMPANILTLEICPPGKTAASARAVRDGATSVRTL